MSTLIRPATVADLPAVVSIYNAAVEHSLAVFTETKTTIAERDQWLSTRRAAGYPVFVCDTTEGVAGFVSFGDFRPWPGYKHTVEHSIYMGPSHQGLGLGTLLMSSLIEAARVLGKHVMVAGVESSNVGSLRFHERLGFEHAGTLREVGHKFGQFLDLTFLCKRL